MKKLNLGCGEDYMPGYTNVDFRSHVEIDVQHNLNELPYPFEDGEFDLVHASHVLEHLDKPFDIMVELHRITKKGGTIHIRVPHFSRGFTHAEHCAGFDVTFPYYFNPEFSKSGYFGLPLKLEKMKMHYMAFFHLLPSMGVGKTMILALKSLNKALSFLANLSPFFCSRVWCFWVGGFEEIEFVFRKEESQISLDEK